MDGKQSSEARSFVSDGENQRGGHMIISQETEKKMKDKSTGYGVLCCELCTRQRKIFVDKVNLTMLTSQIWRDGPPT